MAKGMSGAHCWNRSSMTKTMGGSPLAERAENWSGWAAQEIKGAPSKSRGGSIRSITGTGNRGNAVVPGIVAQRSKQRQCFQIVAHGWQCAHSIAVGGM